METKTEHTPLGRTPLQWLVVNPDGKLLAILDSESEAYWFTRNRGHATGAVFFKAPLDYAAASELLEACKDAQAALALALCGTPSPEYFKAIEGAGGNPGMATNAREIKSRATAALGVIRAAIAKATGGAK